MLGDLVRPSRKVPNPNILVPNTMSRVACTSSSSASILPPADNVISPRVSKIGLERYFSFPPLVLAGLTASGRCNGVIAITLNVEAVTGCIQVDSTGLEGSSFVE